MKKLLILFLLFIINCCSNELFNKTKTEGLHIKYSACYIEPPEKEIQEFITICCPENVGFPIDFLLDKSIRLKLIKKEK